MQFKRPRELKRTRIEIIPMIDTMFFLLVFFMLSSLALTKINGLPVDLPAAKSAPRQAPAKLTLSIDKSQKIAVNRTPVSWQNLQSALLTNAGGAKADLSAATVILNADARVPHGAVVRAIDAAREIGISKFAIATAPESETGQSEAPQGKAGETPR